MSNKPFQKFIHKEVKGAKKKEQIRQEKKQVRAEIQAKTDEIKQRNAEKYGVRTSKDFESRQQTDVSSQKKDDGRKKIADSRWKKDDRKPLAKKKYQTSDIRHQTSKDNKPFAVKQNRQPVTRNQKPVNGKQQTATGNEQMPLNKFVAHAGVCARREAAEMVKQGKVKVDGDIIYEPGFKVSAANKVEINGKRLHPQKNLVYILINKPKDYITTAKDPEGRKTIFDLLQHATTERIYPVGRLDRNTTGVLLLTNDGELAQKLTHPSYEIKKVYEVKLDNPLTKHDFDAVLNGIMLDDGFIKADAVAYADAKDKATIGIEIHSGRNRIVRRVFEHLGYDVKNLDRVMFANLTKKNIERGKWRHLTEKEVRLLKYMNQSFVRSKKE